MANLENAGKRDSRRTEYRSMTAKVKMARPKPERWASIIIVLVFFGTWEVLSKTGMIKALFYPAPSVIGARLFEMTSSGELTKHFIPTISRMFTGAVIGSSAGLLLGLSMGWSRRLQTAIDPIIASLHPIPKMSLFPIILIIFGIGESPFIVMVSISTFFPMLISSMAGVMEISPTYFEVAQNYGAGKLNLFRKVIIPGSLPMILTGARLVLNTALVITIVTEMRFGSHGLGKLIWLSWETLRTKDLYVVIAILAMLGISFNIILSLLRKRLVPWYQ